MTANASTLLLRMRDRIPAQILLEQALTTEDAREAAPWVRAAQGQRIVAALLAALPSGWSVLHSLPLADSDATLAHLLIGPAGVLPVTVVHHPKRRMTVVGRAVTVAGQRLPTVLAAESAGERVGRLLVAAGLGAAPVHPVVAVTAQTRLLVKERPRGVAVLAAPVLRQRLVEKAAVLDAETVAAITAHLDRADLWGPTVEADADLVQRFAELEARVHPRGLLTRRR